MPHQFTTVEMQINSTDSDVLPDEAIRGHYVINIVQSRLHGNPLKTRPASITVENQDRVTWINRLTEPVEIVLHRGDSVFAGFPGHEMHHKFSLEPGSHQTFEVSSVNPREYSYQVYCPALTQFAEGNSDPRIIVL